MTGDFYSIALRHYHIDEDQVNPPLGKAQYVERFGAALGLQDAIALLAEKTIRNPAGYPFVVHDEDGGRRTGEWVGQTASRR
jgi:hypothetical protein